MHRLSTAIDWAVLLLTLVETKDVGSLFPVLSNGLERLGGRGLDWEEERRSSLLNVSKVCRYRQWLVYCVWFNIA